MLTNSELINILEEAFVKNVDITEDEIRDCCVAIQDANQIAYMKFFKFMNTRFQSPKLYPINDHVKALSSNSKKSQEYKESVYKNLNSAYAEMYQSSELAAYVDNFKGFISSLCSSEGGIIIENLAENDIPSWIDTFTKDISSKILLLQYPGAEDDYSAYSTDSAFGFMMRSSMAQQEIEMADGTKIEYCASLYDGSAFAVWARILVGYIKTKSNAEEENRINLYNDEDKPDYASAVESLLFEDNTVSDYVSKKLEDGKEFNYEQKRYFKNNDLFNGNQNNISTIFDCFAFDFSVLYSIIVITQGLMVLSDMYSEDYEAYLKKFNFLNGCFVSIRQAMIINSFNVIAGN